MSLETLKQSTAVAAAAKQSLRQLRVIAAIAIGNAFEWFDFVIYGYFAAIITRLFFPADTSASLLLILASFGVTFLLRPLGAVVLGRYADRTGRKAALQLSILLMMSGSLAIAVVPVYATIGLWAPTILFLARMVQGFSVGGEFGSATALFAEQYPRRRGYYASWQFASQGLSVILATGIGVAITSLLSAEQIAAWGWRIPFFFGVIIGPIGYYIRRHVTETLDEKSPGDLRLPLRAFVVGARRPLLIALGFVILGTVATYTIIFMPTYAVRHLSLSIPNSFAASLLTGALQLLLIPLFGAWSDRIGRTPILLIAAVILLLGSYPALAWLAVEPTIAKLLLVQSSFGIATAAYLGPVPALMSDLFPANMRSSGLSISYAFGVAIFGGFAPFIDEWLIDVTGSVIAPSFYVMAAALIGLWALFAARRLGHR